MTTITYTATGKKNSKKNPAIMNLNIVLDCGEEVSLNLEYTKENGWMPAEDASSRAVYLYCAFVTNDRMWNNKSLQKYINCYFNSVTSWNKSAAQMNWVAAWGDWKYTENKGNEVIVWGLAK
jgi:hypothetical protein